MRYADIPEKILLAAKKFPERTAYEYMGSFITYNELADKSGGLAAYLSEGTSPVVIYGHKSPDFIIALTACLIAGRSFVPCDISIPRERVKRIAVLSGAGLIICTEEGLSADTDIPGISVCELHKLYGGERLSPINEGDENAYIIFTSGSTGEPKGIPVRRESLFNFCGFAEGFLKSDSHTGHALFSFDLSVADIFPALLSGHTLIETDAPPEKDTGSFVCTPTFLRLCLLSESFSRDNFPSLETILCCGETLPRETAKKCLDRFGDIRLINAYGPAECCCFVTAYEVTRGGLDGDIPIGNGENACNVEVREGEIFISGISAAKGYITPSAKSDSFRDNGYYTGDMGEIRDGKLYFKGRKNGFVKYSGFRVELSEIESEILKINGVKDCACTALPDSFGQARCIKAYVAAAAPLSADEIKSLLSLRLPRYMIPKIIEFVSSVPMTPNGKIKI
ncbi:MAG: AMP-binding protein [Huintestinicola sp.]|uniref:AMP-binding protein n=1 Tax=Huintestinicola sp. TaxID=2981661 RepID=UPI003F0B3E8E